MSWSDDTFSREVEALGAEMGLQIRCRFGDFEEWTDAEGNVYPAHQVYEVRLLGVPAYIQLDTLLPSFTDWKTVARSELEWLAKCRDVDF
jgi:hypothetical protein